MKNTVKTPAVLLAAVFVSAALFGEANAQSKKYLVVDISSGANAKKYPVSYLSSAPKGGWGDEYKTRKIVLRLVPAGKFNMGSPKGEPGRSAYETLHEVTITKSFYMGVFEVTQKQFELVTGRNPSCHKGDTRPVECVNVNDIRGDSLKYNWPSTKNVAEDSFIGRIRARTGMSSFDIPTDAQWEYACRAGTTTALNNGTDITSVNVCKNTAKVGRYRHNQSDGKGGSNSNHAAAGSYQPNAWGLYDMIGNVWEWCLDWHGPLNGAAAVDPVGPASGPARVTRGGSWYDEADRCRAADRNFDARPGTYDNFGFRICCGAKMPAAATKPAPRPRAEPSPDAEVPNGLKDELKKRIKGYREGTSNAAKMNALMAFVEGNWEDPLVAGAISVHGLFAESLNDKDAQKWGSEAYSKIRERDMAVADSASAAKDEPEAKVVAGVPPVKIWTSEEASAAMKFDRKPRRKRTFPLVAPAADDGFLDGISPRGAVANMREMIREIVGPLDGADESLFEAKWNAVMDFPNEAIVEWLKKASPIASEVVRIKNFLNEAMSDYTDAVDEANRASIFGAFEDAERLMGEAEDIALTMQSAKDRMAELAAKLEELGEMPDPVEEKKAAAEQRRAAAKTMRDLFGAAEMKTKIGGWYEAAGMALKGAPVVVGRNGRTVGEEPRWTFEKPQDRIYIRPLFKYADSGIVVVYINRNEGGIPDMNLFKATEGADGSLTIFDGTTKTVLSMVRDADGSEYLSMKTCEIVLDVTVSTTLYKYDGGDDLKMLPDSKSDNAVDISVFDDKNPEKAKDKSKKEAAAIYAKLYADQMKDDMESFQKELDKKLKGNTLADMPHARDVYYVLTGMEPTTDNVLKELKGGSKGFHDISPSDGYYKATIAKLAGGAEPSPMGLRELLVQSLMFRCDVKRVDQVYFDNDGKRTPLDSGTAELHARWTPPSVVFRATDNKFAMKFWPSVSLSPLKHAKMRQGLKVVCKSEQAGAGEFAQEFEVGASGKVEVSGKAIASGWIEPEICVDLAVCSLASGNEYGDGDGIGIRYKYKRMVLSEEEAERIAQENAAKFKDAMRQEWSSQEFAAAAKEIDEYATSLCDEAADAVASTEAAAARLEFHNENIKFIDGTISRLKAEAAKEKDESRRRALEWQIVCEESNKIHEQDLIRAGETGEFHASRTPFDTMCRMQVLESAVKEVQSDRIMRQEQERIYAFTRPGSQFKLTDAQKKRVEEAMDSVDRSDPLKAAVEYRKISNNLLNADVDATKGRAAMLDDEILKYEDLLLRAQRVKTGCDIALALGGIAISGGAAAGELAPIMATKFNVIKYTYAMGCGYAESGPMGIVKGAVSTYSDAVDIIWSGVDSCMEAVEARKKGDKNADPVMAFAKGAGWSLFMNKGIPKVMEKVNWRKKITFGKSSAPAPKIDIDTPDVKAYKAEVEKARGDISAYVEAKNKINTMSEVDLASGKITDAQITKLRNEVVRTAAKINENPTAKAILKYEQGYGKIGKDFNLELGRIHSAVKAEFYKDMAAKGFDGLKIKAIRNASSGKSVGMDADWGIDETAKITRNGKPVSAYECMLEGQKSWNAKYEKITGQKAELSWENVTSHVHPEAYRNMEILKANGADAKMRDLLNRTSLADAQQIADVTRFKADEMLNGKQFPRLVYVREAARGSAKDLGGKFLPAIEAKMKPLTRLEGMAGKHGKALTKAQQHELNRLRAAHEYYSKVQKVFDDIGKGKLPPSEWDAKINEVTGGRGISDTLGDLGDLFKSLVFK